MLITISLTHPNCKDCQLIRRKFVQDEELMHNLSNSLILYHLDNPFIKSRAEKGSINVFHTQDGLVTMDQGSLSKTVLNSNYLKWTTPLGSHLRQYLLEASTPSSSSPQKYPCFTCNKAHHTMLSCNQCQTVCCIECVELIEKFEMVVDDDMAWLCVHPNCKKVIAVERKVYQMLKLNKK